MVFKTTWVDRRISLREGAFFFTRMPLFLPLNKRHTRDKAKGLCLTSEGRIGELGVRCLSTANREQDSRQQSRVGVAVVFFIFVVEYAISIKTHVVPP